MTQYDVIVIGAGPGGYVAAIRAAQTGKKVAVVEADQLGGVCLNWGCIPTKALLKNAEILQTVQESSRYGIKVSDVNVDWSRIIKRSRDVSGRLTRGIEFLFKKNKIDWIQGYAVFKTAKTLTVRDSNEDARELTADNVIIAAGARTHWFPGMEPDGERIITSKEALVIPEIPKSIAIIGAGAIGVEFAHLFRTFGSDVRLIEALPRILPVEDEEVSAELTRIFKKRKIRIHTNTKVENLERRENDVRILLNNGDVLEAEKALIAVGVRSNSDKLSLDRTKIQTDSGWIQTDEFMQTAEPGVYAIGDIAGPPWLAHAASMEGITAVEHLAGLNPPPMRYDNIPGCTYCAPEIASVGLTEKEAREQGYELKIGRFPFRALGKAMASGHTDGFVKIIYDAQFGELLGCHIIGTEATNLISEIGVARTLETTHLEILKTIHPHPTLSEAIMEATADALDEAIHI